MNAQDTITILAILTTVLLMFGSWQTAQVARLRRDISKITTNLAVIQQEVMPKGEASLRTRVDTNARNLALLAAKGERS